MSENSVWKKTQIWFPHMLLLGTVQEKQFTASIKFPASLRLPKIQNHLRSFLYLAVRGVLTHFLSIAFLAFNYKFVSVKCFWVGCIYWLHDGHDNYENKAEWSFHFNFLVNRKICLLLLLMKRISDGLVEPFASWTHVGKQFPEVFLFRYRNAKIC